MLLFTVFSIPNYILFYYGSQITETNTDEVISYEVFTVFLSKFTLGNLGEEHTICVSKNYTESAFLNINCNHNGKLHHIVQFG